MASPPPALACPLRGQRSSHTGPAVQDRPQEMPGDGRRAVAISGTDLVDRYSVNPTFSKWRLSVGVISDPVTFLFIR